MTKSVKSKVLNEFGKAIRLVFRSYSGFFLTSKFNLPDLLTLLACKKLKK